MKKAIALILAVFVMGMLAISVRAEGDFLLRDNVWGATFDKITESGSYIGQSNEIDSEEHTWIGESYEIEIDGEKYTVRYDFCDKGLFEVSYFGEEITDTAELNATFNKLVNKLKENYGEPQEFEDSDAYSYGEWSMPTGDISLLKIGNYRVHLFYTAPSLDWDTMSFDVGSSDAENDTSKSAESNTNPKTGNSNSGLFALIILSAAAVVVSSKNKVGKH